MIPKRGGKLIVLLQEISLHASGEEEMLNFSRKSHENVDGGCSS
jgi:hypothetical protein